MCEIRRCVGDFFRDAEDWFRKFADASAVVVLQGVHSPGGHAKGGAGVKITDVGEAAKGNAEKFSAMAE